MYNEEGDENEQRAQSNNSSSGGNTIRLTEVTLPFSYPIAMPLSLKYE